MDLILLDRIYEQYGYKKSFRSTQSVKVYLYEQGRYYGADIVPIEQTETILEDCKVLKFSFSEIGYAVTIKQYTSIDEAETELYRSFFSYDSTLKRLKQKYTAFTKSQSKINGGFPYTYINSPFRLNNEYVDDNNIIDSILEILNQSKPQLVILEAPAGYGKTCTAYELLNALVNSDQCENPLITELQRNRGANIFKYILLDEIDREYSTLDLKLVNYEIRTGRVPLIIDGFDELLHKSDIIKGEKTEAFGEVESMLDTIGNLLSGKAKIILTTRRTAIFAGEEFQKWISKWNGTFETNRFTLEIPKIINWLGYAKLELIKSAEIPIENIANPVLLTYLKNTGDAQFQALIGEPQNIINKYFFSLFEREIERQNLIINPNQQYQIFKNVARLMIQFDISTEQKQFLREIIKEYNKDILIAALSLYPGEDSIDLLVDKLINHAILDRRGYDEDMIGFINDFVFGTFIGEIICETKIDELDRTFSPYMIELGATAYKVQNNENRAMLWEKVQGINSKFESETLFGFDISLTRKLNRDFYDTIFNYFIIVNIKFNIYYKISSSVFIGCRFKNCKFNINYLDSISFIECYFEDCEIEDNNHFGEDSNIITIKCIQKDCDVLFIKPESGEDEISIDEAFEKELLLQLYNLESEFKSQRLIKLISKFKKSERKLISRTLAKLQDEKVIKISGSDVFIQINKLSFVKDKIGVR